MIEIKFGDLFEKILEETITINVVKWRTPDGRVFTSWNTDCPSEINLNEELQAMLDHKTKFENQRGPK